MTDLEMDTAVASRVMGWSPVGKDGEVNGMFWSKEKNRTQMVFGSIIHEQRLKLDILHDKPGDGFCFHPTGNAMDAVQVLEKMPDGITIVKAGGGSWSVSLKGGGYVTADSLGKAVCFAALDHLGKDLT